MEAMSLLSDIASDGMDDSRPVPRKVAVTYATADGIKTADFYAGAEVKAGLVLVPGAARGGKDDRRLVAFAQALARARFAVLVPDIANLRALKVSPDDAAEVAHAVRYLSDRIGLPAGTAKSGAGPKPLTAAPKADTRVGLVAISYAAGPAVMAALRADTRDRVRFVLAIGGYFDVEETVTFFTTGYYRDSPTSPWRHRPPNGYGKWVFVMGNAGRIADPVDRAIVTRMAERKLENPNAYIRDLVRRLRDEGRRVHALLANRDPDKVRRLIADLPDPIRKDIAALNLRKQDFSGLRARLFLVHGQDDPIIPHTESMALARAAGEKRSRLFVVDSMGHTDTGAGGVSDTLTLWQAIYEVLEERDDMRAPVPPPMPPTGFKQPKTPSS